MTPSSTQPARRLQALDSTRCGVLGAGSLGRALAGRLARAGFPVAVYDVAADAVAAATSAQGVRSASSVAELAAETQALLLVLPDTPEILAVVDDLAANLRPGCTVLVISTVAPETPVELARLLQPARVDVLDCPISGGPARAEAGELTVMVGGDAGTFERMRPVLDAIGTSVHHVGPLGHGQIAKLANNLMGAVIVEAIAEGLTLAAKAGADVERVAGAVAAGSGSSWILREWIPETVFRGDYARRFSLDLMCKDMALIAALAERLGVSIPACEVASEQFKAAVRDGYGADDFSRAIDLHARAARTHVGPRA